MDGNRGGTANEFRPRNVCKYIPGFLFILPYKGELTDMKIADRTLCRENCTFSFKEKIEICRRLERLGVDVIELPAVENAKTDVLLGRTVSSFVQESILSVGVGMSAESLQNAARLVALAKHPRIRVEVPVSPVGMEYIAHKKAPKLLEWAAETVAAARRACADVEFCALDATRAEQKFLISVLNAAAEAGATALTVCDNTGEMMPDVFASFVSSIIAAVGRPVGVLCDDRNALGVAASVLAVRAGADCVKTQVAGRGEDTSAASLEDFCNILKNCGAHYGFASRARLTEAHRVIGQIARMTEGKSMDRNAVINANIPEDAFALDANDDKTAVAAAVAKLGYDLSDEDIDAVFAEFCRVAEKKRIGAKELEAIISGVAMQVPPTYTLVSYMVTGSNMKDISSGAQIVLDKNGERLQGISMGNGPIDAAFVALEQIMGTHFELDDFQIQSVTEGKEAMGSALVKLRADGKLYAGNGLSTDIIGASIRAYINAVNKIVFERG